MSKFIELMKKDKLKVATIMVSCLVFIVGIVTTFNNSIGDTYALEEYITCAAGEYYSGQSKCSTCAAGYYCPGGSYEVDSSSTNRDGIYACPSGFTSDAGASALSDCKVVCQGGYYYSASGTCSKCLAGSYCPGATFYTTHSYPNGIRTCPGDSTSVAGSRTISSCEVTCKAGEYYSGEGKCSTCEAGYYCSGGTFSVGDNSAGDGMNKCDDGQTSEAGASACTSTDTGNDNEEEKDDDSSGGSSSGGSDDEGTTETTKYIIKYDANGGGGAPSSQTKVKGTTLTLSSTVPTMIGYTFSKWNTESDGSGTDYKSGATYDSDESVTLYAQWDANGYKIRYNLNGGTISGNPSTAKYGDTITIKSPSKVVYIVGNDNNTGADIGKTTYLIQTFVGWTSASIDTTTAYYGSTAWTDGNTKVKATSFKNLASIDGAIVTLVANWDPVVIKLPTISKEGYTCYWNSKADGSGTDYESGGSYLPTANSDVTVNVYAICEINSETEDGSSTDNKTDEEITTNSKTGDVLITLVWLIGIGSLCYSIYYFRSNKNNI